MIFFWKMKNRTATGMVMTTAANGVEDAGGRQLDRVLVALAESAAGQ